MINNRTIGFAHRSDDATPIPPTLAAIPSDSERQANAAERQPSPTDTFRNELLETVPALRGFAFSLVGSRYNDRAEDLVQETLVKAWAHRASFQPGTNFNAWVHTILRNEFYSQMRRRGREVEDADGVYSSKLAVAPEQYGRLDMADMEAALQELPDEQREAILLVAVSGFSYEEAAAICKVAVGTIKSRVNRARSKLAETLAISGEGDYAPDANHCAGITSLALQR